MAKRERREAVTSKGERTGLVTSFRQNRHRQDTYQTIVRVQGVEDPKKLIGARAVWRRDDGVQIRGVVVASHGRGASVRIRWSRGFPPQAIGSQVTIRA